MNPVGFSVLGIFSAYLSPLTRGHYYLDPGSGSYLIQLLIATLLGGAFMLRTYWTKISSFIRRIFGKEPGPEADDE